MNFYFALSRKYRWAEHYFSLWCLKNSQKLLIINQFLVSVIFFTIIKVSFFNLRFDLFSIIVKEVNQIRNNVVCVIIRLVFLFCCAITAGRWNVFHNIFVNQKNQNFTAHISRLCYFLWLWWNRTCPIFSKLDQTNLIKQKCVKFCCIHYRIYLNQ